MLVTIRLIFSSSRVRMEGSILDKSLGQRQHLIDCVGCIASHHAALRHGAKPGELALGELARGKDAFVAQLVHGPGMTESARFVRVQSVQILPGLTVTD